MTFYQTFTLFLYPNKVFDALYSKYPKDVCLRLDTPNAIESNQPPGHRVYRPSTDTLKTIMKRGCLYIGDFNRTYLYSTSDSFYLTLKSPFSLLSTCIRYSKFLEERILEIITSTEE